MENDKSFYEVQKNGFSAIFNLKFGTLINKDTLRKYSAQNVFLVSLSLLPIMVVSRDLNRQVKLGRLRILFCKTTSWIYTKKIYLLYFHLRNIISIINQY